MNESFVFTPPRRFGMVFHGMALLALGAGGAWALWRAANAEIGPLFLIYLFLALLAVSALPLVAYRAYALQSASYALERDGIRLRWGLRIQVIPMDEVIWVHTAVELSKPMPLPWLRWPGAVVGVRHLPGEREVEYMSASVRQLIFIATESRLYAISPQDPGAFLNAFRRSTEMGSLSPLPARAQHPVALFTQVWSTTGTRALLLTGLILCLVLLVWVSLAIPSRDQVHMGFYPDGSPGALVPAPQLLLLPVLCALFYVIDFFLGLFFYRRVEARPLSYLLWVSGALTPLLSLVAMYFIMRAG
jgi:hypothetical protein